MIPTLSNMMTAGIVGPYRLHNFGDDLIGLVLASLLKSVGISKVQIQDIAPVNAAIADSESSDFWTIVKKCDLVIIGGGHILGDGSLRPGSYYQRLGMFAAATRKLAAKPTVYCGVGAGPLELRRARLYASLATRLVGAVGVRDEESRQFVEDILRCRATKVRVGADLALLTPRLGLGLKCISSCKRRLGIQLDAIPTSRQSAIGASIRAASREFDEVIYLSNRHRTTSAREIVGIDGTALTYTHMSNFLVGLMSCDVLITSHLHLAIAAYSLGIPSVTFAINRKTSRFYAQVRHPERCIQIEQAEDRDIANLARQASHLAWAVDDQQIQFELRRRAESLVWATLDAAGISS